MTLDMEGLDGVVDDTPAEQPDVASQSELISGLQDQLQNMESQLKSAAAIKAEKDEVIDRFSKAIGFIEGSGTGKYDPETGQIIKVEQQQAGPDPMETLQSQIASAEKELMQQFKDGDITQAEYYEELQANVAPLKDQYREMQFDNKLLKMKEELSSGKKDTNQKETTVDSSKAQIFDQLADEYPDISNKDSQLFQKMNEIYLKNPKIYNNANYNEGKGDPDQFKDLIERASIELKAQGIDVKKQQAAIRNKFATPTNNGYQEPEKKGNDLSKQELGMMVSQGITSKSLLSQINSAVGSWENTGSMELDD